MAYKFLSIEELSPFVKPDVAVLWNCGDYYVDCLATEEERNIAEHFSKRNEIFTFCIDNFDHDLLNKCAIDHPDLLNVDSESYLGYVKSKYCLKEQNEKNIKY